MKHRLFASLMALVAVSAHTVSHAQQQPVKIGFLATFSGPAGALGQDQYDAFMLAIEHGGGKLGGASVQVIKEDDGLKPDLGTQLAQKLVEKDKVAIITGVTFSNVMMAVHKPITDAGVFLIGSNAGPSLIAGKGCSPLFFSTSWNNDTQHEAMGQHATDAGYKRMFLLAPNYQAGKESLGGFKNLYKGTVIDEVYTQINQPDYSVEIAQIQSAKPDAVYVFYPGGMGVNFVKQYQQAGLLGKLPLLSTATVEGTTLPALNEAAIGMITGTPYTPDLNNPTNTKFVADFTKKFGRVPSQYAAQSYDAAMLIGSALAKTGGRTENKESLRSALKAANFNSVGGPFRFGTNQFPIRNYYRADVGKDSSGRVTLVNKGVALKDHQAPFYRQCPLK